MNMLIAGGGKLGEMLCSELSSEGHDLTLIDTNEQRAERLMEAFDISSYAGSAVSVETLTEAGAGSADFFLAVTPKDEINIIACLMAARLGARCTAARVRNPEFVHNLDFLRGALGIDLLINPDYEAAREVSRGIRYPSALSVESFAHGKAIMVAVRVTRDCLLHGLQLSDFRQHFRSVLVCSVQRGGDVVIPTGNFILKAGDVIEVTGTAADLEEFYRVVGFYNGLLRSVLIVGGSRSAWYLTEMLLRSHIDVKIIERDEKAAARFAAAFPSVHVLVADGSDHNVLEEARISAFDAVVAFTGIDEQNAFISLFARRKGVRRTITKINRVQLLDILGEEELQSIVTPTRIIGNHILRFARSLTPSDISNINALYRIAGNQAEAIEFELKAESQVTGIPLSELTTRPNLLIAFIRRGSALIFPGGSDQLLPGDRVLVVSKDKAIADIDDILGE